MDFREVESYLTNIKSVMSCKIIADENNKINEIHVLSDNSRHTKQIARDIRSALLSRFDIAIDHKLISVAQIIKNLTVNTDFRLVYDGYTNETTSDRINIKTKLSWDGKNYIGEAEGIKSEKNTLKVAALSTLDAIKNAIGLDCFIVEDIQTANAAGSEVVLAAITYIDHGEENILMGTSIVVNNTIDSTIKATLNAINRKICLFFKEWSGWQTLLNKTSEAKPPVPLANEQRYSEGGF